MNCIPKFIYIIAVICFIFSSMHLVIYYTNLIYVPKKYETLSTFSSNEITLENQHQQEKDLIEPSPVPESQLSKSLKINQDVTGWLNIDGTNIHYPVAQTTDNVYYLNHDLWRDENGVGTPFLDYRLHPNSDVLVIYGHNLKNGSMFSQLLNYKEQSFYNEHPIIEFETLLKTNYYQIASVLSITTNEQADVLNTLIQSTDQSAKQTFFSMLAREAIFYTQENLKVDDRLLILCTCDNKQNSRLLIIAKKLSIKY